MRRRVALVATLTVGPLSGARPGWGWRSTPEHRAVIAEALATVPDGACVSADNALGAQLSERERITTFPLIGGADYVVLDSQGRYGAWRARALEEAARGPGLRARVRARGRAGVQARERGGGTDSGG